MKFHVDAKTVLYIIANILIIAALFKVFRLTSVIIYIVFVIGVTAIPFVAMTPAQRKRFNAPLTVFYLVSGLPLACFLLR